MPPSKRPARRPDPEPDPPDDEIEDEAPPVARKRAASPVQGSTRGNGDEELKLRRGWTDAQKQMDSTSSYAQTFKPDENVQFIKFLEDESYANFRRHWIERMGPQGRTVRAYTCLQSFDGEECPLCKIGEKPQATAAFNIAIVGDDGQLLLKSWDVGPRLFNVLKAYANDPKIAPLTRGFFMVNKSGGSKGGTVQYNVSPVRASSMEEDYDMTVPTQAEFDKLVLYTRDIIEIPTKKTLRDVANELADEDYDD